MKPYRFENAPLFKAFSKQPGSDNELEPVSCKRRCNRIETDAVANETMSVLTVSINKESLILLLLECNNHDFYVRNLLNIVGPNGSLTSQMFNKKVQKRLLLYSITQQSCGGLF